MPVPFQPIAAASLIVFREAAGRPAELLMVERATVMAFAAGAMVFPGGRVDSSDRVLAASGLDRQRIDLDDAAARIAAIRETIEETGLAIGLDPIPCPAHLAAIRAGLGAGRSLAALLADASLSIAPPALVTFARWRPQHLDRRIYDTRFFLARLPDGSAEAVVDGTENMRLIWTTAEAVLDDAGRGRVHLIYPTRRLLERLASHTGFDAAVADARRYPLQVVTPWVEDRGGVAHLCIPDHLGYPVTSEPVDTAQRG